MLLLVGNWRATAAELTTLVHEQRLRSCKPRSFATLCELPNTFQKVHYKRDKPVHIVYQRHHIVVNHLQQVRSCVLSPAPIGVT